MCLFVTAACATDGVDVRPNASEYPRIPSQAIAQDASTSLGRALMPRARANEGKSGFRLLTHGDESFHARLAMVRAAEKTIDLQYYAIHDDTASNLMLEAILRAAERGVRVRFLIDNITVPEVGQSLALLDHRKNIEIRVFNPMTTRDQSILSRFGGLFLDIDKATKRMHNKSLIADNQLAIIGGRNIGDEYFDEHSDVNFKDVDILTAGPVTARISASFDRYWNSEESFPIAQVVHSDGGKYDVEKLRAEMKKNWEERAATPEGRRLLKSDASELFDLTWAPAELSVDDPHKVQQSADDAQSKPLTRMERLTQGATREFVAVSPYFVPREEGVAWLSGLVERGLRVRVLTNSLASTDVVVVHTGYKRYREELVRKGVELYEFKPIDGERPRQRIAGASAPPQASLHSKIYVIDGKDLVVGSHNLDPRSQELNTEIAVIIHSPKLAQEALELFEESVSPEQSYRLRIAENDELIWEASEDGVSQIYHRDPKPGIGRSLQVMFMSLLPVEDQL